MENAAEKTGRENKAVVRQAIEKIYNNGSLAAIVEFYAPDYRYHSNSSPEVYGPEGVKALVERRRLLMPDAAVRVEEQIAQGDKVVTRWTMREPHQEDSAGGISIDTVVDGQITESWAEGGVILYGLPLPN